MQHDHRPITDRAGTQPVDLVFRQATADDLGAIVLLLDNDDISAARQPQGERSMAAIRDAFDEISRDPNNEMWLAVARSGAVLACLQLTLIPGLSRNGMRRAQVEAVRVDAAVRGQGIGAALMRHVIERARQRGCGLIQLTTDVRRQQAHRFYARLGFEPSHVGMKLALRGT